MAQRGQGCIKASDHLAIHLGKPTCSVVANRCIEDRYESDGGRITAILRVAYFAFVGVLPQIAVLRVEKWAYIALQN
jgi:hypothetical protein